MYALPLLTPRNSGSACGACSSRVLFVHSGLARDPAIRSSGILIPMVGDTAKYFDSQRSAMWGAWPSMVGFFILPVRWMVVPWGITPAREIVWGATNWGPSSPGPITGSAPSVFTDSASEGWLNILRGFWLGPSAFQGILFSPNQRYIPSSKCWRSPFSMSMIAVWYLTAPLNCSLDPPRLRTGAFTWVNCRCSLYSWDPKWKTPKTVSEDVPGEGIGVVCKPLGPPFQLTHVPCSFDKIPNCAPLLITFSGSPASHLG